MRKSGAICSASWSRTSFATLRSSCGKCEFLAASPSLGSKTRYVGVPVLRHVIPTTYNGTQRGLGTTAPSGVSSDGRWLIQDCHNGVGTVDAVTFRVSYLM